MIKYLFRFLALFLVPVCTVIFCVTAYVQPRLPSSFSVCQGDPLTFANGWLFTEAVTADGTAPVAARRGDSYEASVRLWGLFPVGQVTVEVAEEQTVAVCGTPFGIKMYTDGVLVVGLSDVDTDSGGYSPAQAAGLLVGDIVTAVGGEPVRSIEEAAAAFEHSGGEPVTLTVRRGQLSFEASFQPVRSVTEERYKAGMWIRDSAAGIGTLTFFDPKNGVFAGLGHPINDVDTGQTMPIADGEVVPARIYSVTKGESGTPGALNGGFEWGTLGKLIRNEETGLFGVLSSLPTEYTLLPLAQKQEVVSGEAQILTTVNGTAPQMYTVRVERINYSDAVPSRNMTVTVTDPVLLAQTGGIVQGMSGSPVIQGGKLIGAVTHVLVGDPTRGYAVFAENMLTAARTVAPAA